MFRTKKDVDRHKQDIFRKLKNENEEKLRSYNIAKLYYQVGDYESAKRYVSSYLEVRESAAAHKLLGQAFEALGQKEAALSQYKVSLELEGRQDDLVLKVCELLADMDTGMDIDRVRYWMERADKIFPHHPVVFQLKEKMLTVERPNDNNEDFEALIASELSARPSDVQLRIKLLKHYIGRHRLEDAFNHAIDVEVTQSHRNSIVWYQSFSELLAKCKENKHTDWTFWVFYVSALERYAALSLREQGNEIKKTVPEATQAVFNFDQSLTELKSKNFIDNSILIENMLTHMWGQLNFHLACLFLRKTKRGQGSWSEAGRLCAPLLLSALHVTPIDPTASWAIHLKNQLKSQILLWYKEGSYRCSQSGHVLQDYARDNAKKLMDKIDKFCTGSWRERIYPSIFENREHQQQIRTSYFSNHITVNPPLRLSSYSELKRYDEIAEEVWPDSLHHQVWLGLKSRPRTSQNNDAGSYPYQVSHVFPDLQFSVYNLSQAAPDTLSRLDIDAFLNATIFCFSVIVEEQRLSGFLSRDRLPTLPADLTNTLCTCAQEKWWYYSYKMYSKQEMFEGDIGEIRHELQRGLEVVRCIGNHGLHPSLIVHLARIFHHRAKLLKEKDKEHADIPALEARSELYWSTAIPLLERLQNNQTIRISSNKLFNYQGKEMNNVELTNALEEGRLLLAQRFLRDKQYERAIEALQVLKCPEASFQQGQIYKMLADEMVASMPRESLTSEMRSQHSIMLLKARDCLYLTSDRLRSPGANPKHPLNSELGTHISDIENELKRIDPDVWQGDLRNECDGMSDESCSSAHSAINQPITNAPLQSLPGLGTSVNILSTPQRNTHRTPKQSSTPSRPQHQDILDLSRNRTEARPSPERLDAQIRQMLHARDNVMQTIVEQNKALLEANKTMMEKIEELTKEMAELRKDTQRQRTQSVNINPNLEEDLYVLGEEDYGDLNYNANQSGPTSSISGNMFTSSHRHPYSPLVYNSTTFQGYYQAGIPFSDPNAQPIPSLYPPNVYPMPVLYPNRSKIPEGPILQQGLFTSRLPTQMPDMMPPPLANQPMQMPPPPLQKVETSKVETPIIKDAPLNKAPPVNVVITTSDTLPTTVPLVQPTLSVTIPAQHRLGTTFATVTEQSNAPHCYQISMPPQATIPTTVNLPPLPATLTTTPAHISVPETSKVNNINVYYPTSPNNSAEICETEHDPIPDFEPVVPLPAEVKVTTGEEDEVELYCARAKLYRFVDKEWKERGTGNVKLLRSPEGKVRLLMRRDQVLKICANHMLRPDMELTSMPENDKAWIWIAHDFADEKVKLEKLCIKFKTPEEALSFKEHFNKAKSFSAQGSSSKAVEKTLKDSVKSNIEESPFVSSSVIQKQTNETMSTSELGTSSKPKNILTTTTATTITTVGGFSFTSKPNIQKVDINETVKTPQKPEESQKVNPFARFQFGMSAVSKPLEVDAGLITTPLKGASISTTVSATTQPAGFPFMKTTGATAASLSESTSSVAAGLSNTTTIFSSQMPIASSTGNVSVSATGTSQTSLRKPHAPPPAAIQVSSDAGIHAHEVHGSVKADEEILFEQKANLERYNKDTKQWDNKGSGKIKILISTKTSKVRLLMVDEATSKICYNHRVSAGQKFTLKSGNSNVVTWSISHGKEECKTEALAATFKLSAQASQFHQTLLNYQQKMIKDSIPVDTVKKEMKEAKKTTQKATDSLVAAVDKTQKPLSELYKPSPNSWECSTCYVRNQASDTKCVSCGNPSPAAATGKSFTTNTTSISNQTPLSQLFKPAQGSWECPCCLINNIQTNQYCVACDAPKDPSMPPKRETSGFQLGATAGTTMTTFKFGIPQDTSKETTSGFNFLATTKPEDKSIDESAIKFGVPQKPSTPPKKESPFSFGSPGKSFDFHFHSKSPVKSPGRGGENSEEEIVESDDIHFSPVIPLPDKIEVKTGEEDELVLYSHRAKLYRFDGASKEWKERGIGDIKLLKHKETNKLRLIMRRDQILKLCLNHFILPTVEFIPKDEKTWVWNAADYSERELEYMQFACRFKTAEIAKMFKTAIDDARESGNVSVSSETPGKKESMKEPAKTSPTQDIQVVYELKVTPEEKAAAQEYQLPENFYAYKYKEDCPGCRGCREPETALFEDTVTQEVKLLESNKASLPVTTTIATSIKFSSPASVTPAVTTTSSFVFKTGFLAPTTTVPLKPSSSTTSITFGNASMPSGNSEFNIFSDKKSTFSFGRFSPQVTNNETGSLESTTSSDKQSSASLLENLKICSMSTSQPSTTTASKSIFGGAKTSINSKGDSLSILPGKSIFGGNTKTAESTALIKSASFNIRENSPTFGATSVFGSRSSTFDLSGSTAASPLTLDSGISSTYGTSNKPAGSVFDNASLPSSSNLSFGGISNNVLGNTEVRFGNSNATIGPSMTTTAATLNNTIESKTTESTQGDNVSYFPANNMTFLEARYGNSNATVTVPSVTITTTATIPSVTTATTATIQQNNVFESKTTESTQDDDISFLPVNNITFSSLAAKTPQQEAFKRDPNFSFAGTGLSVFGSKHLTSNEDEHNKTCNESKTNNNDEEPEKDEENENDQEYDPHFEPIIPMPDTIEVRTGEEEEEKIFCERSKLYRYDADTKEWKERGVGEMKILYHARRGSYRLLLRREQVFKVVCNFLLTPDIEFLPLATSDRAWMWAGMNYAEKPSCCEQLAIKFKYPELFAKFKDIIDNIQQTLRERQNNQGEKDVSDVGEQEPDENDDEEEDEINDNEDDEEDDVDDENSLLFEKRATLYAKAMRENKWKLVASGNLQIYYDSNIFGSKIILKVDESDQVVSNTVISMDTAMHVEGKECIWSAIDQALKPPACRILKATFSSVQAAQQMCKCFQEGLEHAKDAGISVETCNE